MSDDFITIREATELTGKADITIRRLIKHLIKQNNPEATQLIKQEQAGGGFIYKISKDYLLKEFKINEPTKEPEEKERFADTIKKEQTETPEIVEVLKAKNETINLLKGELYKKDGQLKTKDWQIGSLGKKIDNLIERDHETNVILKSLQDRVFMLEAPKTPRYEDLKARHTKEPRMAESKPTGAEGGEKQAIRKDLEGKPKKKGFFSRLFNSKGNTP